MNIEQLPAHGPESAAPDLATSFRAAMRRVTATVTIVTTGDRTRRYGMTATAVTSVSVEPPSILVCINQSAGLHAFLLSNDKFCVNVLHCDQAAHASAFSGALQGEARFEVGDWKVDLEGTPYLADAQANLFCGKAGAIPYASHTIFLGEVREVRTMRRVTPLLYNDGAYVRAGRRHAL